MKSLSNFSYKLIEYLHETVACEGAVTLHELQVHKCELLGLFTLFHNFNSSLGWKHNR